MNNNASRKRLLTVETDGQSTTIIASGKWIAPNSQEIDRLISSIVANRPSGAVTIDLSDIDALDTFGAWEITRLSRELTSDQREPSISGIVEPIHCSAESRAGSQRARRQNSATAPSRFYRPCGHRRSCCRLRERASSTPQYDRSRLRSDVPDDQKAFHLSVDVGDQSARSRGVAGNSDRCPHHLSDRRHHRSTGLFTISESLAPTTTSWTWLEFLFFAKSAFSSSP